MVRRIIAYIAAVAVMVVLGSVSHSVFVQEAWVQASGLDPAGQPIQLAISDRLGWIGHDLIGLEPLYGALVGAALLIAFLASGLLTRFTGLRTIVFAVAGGIAIFVMFTLMKSQLGTVGVFGARGLAGLGAQMAAGLIAGFIFAAMSRPRSE